jgi:hypothetical protein
MRVAYFTNKTWTGYQSSLVAICVCVAKDLASELGRQQNEVKRATLPPPTPRRAVFHLPLHGWAGVGILDTMQDVGQQPSRPLRIWYSLMSEPSLHESTCLNLYLNGSQEEARICTNATTRARTAHEFNDVGGMDRPRIFEPSRGMRNASGDAVRQLSKLNALFFSLSKLYFTDSVFMM